MMRIIRHTYPNKTTIGTWYLANGTVLCWTIEDEVREDGVFVPDETAIPAGVHTISNSMSPKFHRVLPHIYSSTIAASRGIRVHRGRHIGHSRGCVLVGLGVVIDEPPHLLDADQAEIAVVQHLHQLGGTSQIEIINQRAA